jgi:ABC-2 type transport system ATP-binding protein
MDFMVQVATSRIRSRQRPPAKGASPVCLRGVTKHYKGGGGVDDLTFDLGAGEVFGFLGPNGAGKTTTIRLLLDLIRPDAGRITLFGLDARRESVQARRLLGYLPGDLTLYERLTPRELLTHFAYLRGGLPWNEVADLADRFALELDRPIRALSKGNRQKVGLVQALMGRPALLVLDEPTSGLDPLVQHQVQLIIREVVAEGRTVFLSSHMLSEVGQVADRVGLIREGRVVAIERIAQLRRRSVHLVDISIAQSVDPSIFDVSGVVSRETKDGNVHLEVAGSLDPLIGVLAGVKVADLSVREPDLEELFLSYYEAPHAAK